MDDVDAFLASLDRFSSPTIDAGIEHQLSQQAPSQPPAAAPRQGEGSSNGAPSSLPRRRSRKDSTERVEQQPLQGQSQLPLQPQRQRQRTTTDAEWPAYAAIDVDSPTGASDAAASPGSVPTWWCVRCSAENSTYMQSCAICHHRRQRAEGPRPHFTVSPSQQPAPQSSTTGPTSFVHLPNSTSVYALNCEPAVMVAPGEVSCPRCTFINSPSRHTCEMCDGPLPLPPPHLPTTINGSSTSSSAPCAAVATAVVPSVTLPGVGGSGATRPSANARSGTPPPYQTRSMPTSIAGEHSTGTTSATVANGAVALGQRPPVMQGAARETLSLSPVVLSRCDDTNAGDASSDSESSSSDASDHDSDWDGQQTSQHEAQDHRELVRFLETLQSVQFDDLPFAAVPASMRARAELRPFQLQALYWLLTREQQSASQDKEAFDDDSDTRAAKPLKESGFQGASGQAKAGGAEWRGGFGSSDGLRHVPNSSPAIPPDTSSTVQGGVFADFMGLGKTRTLIALCEAARAPRVDRVTGSLVESTATLVVCPTSLLTQWVEELQRCVERPPSAPLRVLVYYGARKRRLTLFQIAQSYDYVITTYQTLAHEPPPRLLSVTTGSDDGGRSGWTSRLPQSSGGSFFDADPYDCADEFTADGTESYDVDRHLQTEVGKLFMIRWARIILDEAHYIRNMRTRQSRSCMRLSGVFRWVVTATPVQNSLNDLYPLLRFLGVPHFSSLQWWNDEIVRYYNQDPRHPRPVTALSILFRSILLRRTPESLVAGRPLLDLPPKQVVTHTVALSREETQFYKAIHTNATEKLNALRQRDTFTPSSPLATFTTAFEMLVRCRQTCLHPYIVVAALRKCHGLPGDVDAGKTATQRAASTSRSAALAQSQREEQQRQEAEEQVARALDHFIQSVVLRRLHTTKASEFVQLLVSEIKRQKLEARECIICLDTVNRPAILPCAHVFCEECITHALEATRRCPLCKRATKNGEMLLVPVELLDSAQHPTASGSDSSGAVAGGSIGQERGRTVRSEEADPPPEVPADLDLTNVANWGLRLSSKTQYLIDIIQRVPAVDKVVVFSSFLTYLRYAQHWLEDSGITCAIYSGSMTMRQKQLLLDKFRDAAQPDSPRVLLATISSCGVGLNLTCANHCFLMEPSWNPSTEDQALNRIHRIGQAKPVTVTKLIAGGTVEENIRQLCERKRALSGYCFGDGGAGGGGGGRLRTADLLALFAPEDEESSEEGSDDDGSDEEEESD